MLRASAALAGLGLAGITPSAQAEQADRARRTDEAGSGYLVGRGVADATGEIAEVGMMGYGRIDQQAQGLHTRLRARAASQDLARFTQRTFRADLRLLRPTA